MQHSIRVRNAVAEAITATINAASTTTNSQFQLYTGTAPLTCAMPATGTLLGSAPVINPAFMGAGFGGSQASVASVAGVAVAAGTVGYYRWIAGDGSCDEQGTVTLQGGGGDLQFTGASLALAVGQPFTLQSRTITAGNA